MFFQLLYIAIQNNQIKLPKDMKKDIYSLELEIIDGNTQILFVNVSKRTNGLQLYATMLNLYGMLSWKNRMAENSVLIVAADISLPCIYST